MKLSADVVARRCLDCDLVSIARGDQSPHADPQGHAGLPDALMIDLLQRLAENQMLSVLLVGVPSPAVAATAHDLGVTMMVLSEPGSGEVPGIPTFQAKFENHSFLPDQFDLILCARGLESFTSPSLLFDRARHWLAPGGTLLVGSLNFGSLPARMRRGNWLARYGMTSEYLLSLDVIKGYAERFGFDIRSVRTRSNTGDVAAVITGHERPAWLTEMAVAPVALMASLLGMGVMVIVEMTRGGLAVRPLLRTVEEQAEGTPGLAPALYTGVQRELVTAGPGEK
ncbi:MAG: methyltransferase domain-containing protein [Candidatus Kapaibacterium sp.]